MPTEINLSSKEKKAGWVPGSEVGVHAKRGENSSQRKLCGVPNRGFDGLKRK